MNDNQKHILVVDDDHGITDVIKIILEEQGFKVSVSLGSDQVDDLINKNKPNLLLLDILMYGTSGPEIVKLLRSKINTKDIPIILMSASENTKKIAKTVGANGYLEKPFNINYLVEMVNKYIN